jgi:hypothetical protein
MVPVHKSYIRTINVLYRYLLFIWRGLKWFLFVLFLWVIFGLLVRIPDPDPLTRLNPDAIRFRIRNTVLKGRKPGLFVNFGQFPCSWIRIRIPNTDPDPGQPNECGSGSKTLVELFVVANLIVMFCRTRHNGREPSQALLDAINQDPDLRWKMGSNQSPGSKYFFLRMRFLIRFWFWWTWRSLSLVEQRIYQAQGNRKKT